jgi:predicted acylesterase/phospholipase RssA
MNILICTVSGGNFISQIACLYQLLKAGHSPDVCMGSSGGSVAITSLLYSQGNFDRLRMFVEMMDCTIFLENWLPFFPYWSIGPFQGSAYKHSTKLLEIGKSIITPGLILKHETWVLTYNQSLRKPHLFVNKEINRLKLKPNNNNVYALTVSDTVEKYIKSILASCSIPAVLPPLEIDEEMHVDGGAYAATPLSLFTSEIKKNKKIHLFYVMGNDINEKNKFKENEKLTIIDTTVTCSDALFRNSILRDKLLCFDVLEHYGKTVKLDNVKSLKEAIEESEKYTATLIILYPKKKSQVDLRSFSKKEALSTYDDQINHITFELWVTTNK